MKKILVTLIICFVLLLSLVSIASDQVNVLGYTPVGYSRITVIPTAVSQLSATLKATAGAVFITVETNNVRYTIVGGDPSATLGHLVVAASYQNIWLNDPSSIREFRVIAIGGNAILHITYYKRN